MLEPKVAVDRLYNSDPPKGKFCGVLVMVSERDFEHLEDFEQIISNLGLDLGGINAEQIRAPRFHGRFFVEGLDHREPNIATNTGYCTSQNLLANHF